MDKKISELTVDELKEIIAQTVKDSIEDILEDIKALSSKNYIDSIKEAREEYKRGEYKSLEEL